jgi:hypothetical protein
MLNSTIPGKKTVLLFFLKGKFKIVLIFVKDFATNERPEEDKRIKLCGIS